MVYSYRDYTNSKRHDRLKRSAKTMSMALYFFLAALLTCGAIVVMG